MKKEKKRQKKIILSAVMSDALSSVISRKKNITFSMSMSFFLLHQYCRRMMILMIFHHHAMRARHLMIQRSWVSFLVRLRSCRCLLCHCCLLFLFLFLSHLFEPSDESTHCFSSEHRGVVQMSRWTCLVIFITSKKRGKKAKRRKQ